MSVKVLFICVHNSARSQMAEAFVNTLGQGRFEAQSAGLAPTRINPLVVEVMAEEGIDLSAKATNSVFDFFRGGQLFDVVVTVCNEAEEENCPVFPGVTHRLSLPFPDITGLTGTHGEQLAHVKKLRDSIKKCMLEFMDWYDHGRQGAVGPTWDLVRQTGRCGV